MCRFSCAHFLASALSLPHSLYSHPFRRFVKKTEFSRSFIAHNNDDDILHGRLMIYMWECLCVTLWKSFQSIVLLRTTGECAILNIHIQSEIFIPSDGAVVGAVVIVAVVVIVVIFLFCFAHLALVSHKQWKHTMRVKWGYKYIYGCVIWMYLCVRHCGSNTLLDKAV